LRRTAGPPVEGIDDDRSAADDQDSDGDDQIDADQHDQRSADASRHREPSAGNHRQHHPGGVDDHVVEARDECRDALVIALDVIPAIDGSFGTPQQTPQETRRNNKTADGDGELHNLNADGPPCRSVD
jgi:hypothetical protein